MVSFTIAATSPGVHTVRGLLVKELAGAGVLLTDEEAFALGLLVSEIATNALVHGVGGEDPQQRLTVEAEIAGRGGQLRVAVSDPGCGVPEPGPAEEESEHGRGLLLVAAYAAAHGHELDAECGGKRVWFELALSALDQASEPIVARCRRPVRLPGGAGPAAGGASL
ncbi:ATP-binding protein [Kitasatospora sp. NPDC006697]|uniref:ATP-binding protein n=1 Tax=Kitasatospora sp. NPDC006697 TaxID=3364020 RepID=UPI00368D3011